jgi:oxaloacetate decarboxylase alpha subunit
MTVQKNDPLLVVEAMKMETAISAPKSGTISDVYVSDGDAVAVGDPLVAIS